MLNTHLFLEIHSDVWPRFSITTICDQLVVHFLENSPGGCSAGNPSSNLAERAERNGADKHGEEKNDLHGSGWNVGWFCRCHIYTASQVASSAIFHCLAILVHLNLICFLFFGEERWRNIIHGCDGTCKGTFRKTHLTGYKEVLVRAFITWLTCDYFFVTSGVVKKLKTKPSHIAMVKFFLFQIFLASAVVINYQKKESD